MAHSTSPPPDLLQQVTDLLNSLPSTLPPPAPRPLPPNPAGHIDHTLLSPSATSQQIKDAVQEAVQLNAKTICVPSCWVGLAAQTIEDLQASVPPEHRVLPICTISFPHGNASTQSKVHETQQAVKDGAKEVDMVQNVGWVKEGKWEQIWYDISAVVQVATSAGVQVKVILETASLTRDEIAASTLVSCLAGVDYVKTSTGFSPSGGASPTAIHLMHHIAAPFNVKVKASGGIRTWNAFEEMWKMGSDRVGLSGTRGVLEGWKMGGGDKDVGVEGQGRGGY